MEQVKDTGLFSLDEIAVFLKHLSSNEQNEPQSAANFYQKVITFFPDIYYTRPEQLWDDLPIDKESFIPLWWDDLDEPYELDTMHWLTKIQKYALLKPNEVKTTMEAIEAGVFAKAALVGELQNFDLHKYGTEKIERIIQSGEEAFQHMLAHNLKLALHLARKYARRVGLEDAFQYACFGLMQAIRKFDWRLGHQFSTYATWWIRQSLSREIADHESTIRLPVHQVDKINKYKFNLRHLNESIYTTADEVVIKDSLGNIIRKEPPLQQLTLNTETDKTFALALDTTREPLEFWDTFHQAPWLLKQYEIGESFASSTIFLDMSTDLIKRLTDFVLSDREIKVIKLRSGYESDNTMTLDEIGKIYGLTRERIRQLESQALKKIHEFLDGVTLENYWDVIDAISVQYKEQQANSPAVLAEQKRKEAKQERNKREEERNKQARLRKERLAILKENRSEEGSMVAGDRNALALENSNRKKSILAGESHIAKLKWALEKTQGDGFSELAIQIAKKRISNPELSLRDIAVSFDNPLITKDSVAGTIRRLIARASKISGEIPPEKNPGS